MLSLLIPTYNERENILSYIPRLREICVQTEKNFEIIIIDDNSPDKTWEAAVSLGKKFPEVRSYRRFGERGLGSAILFGVSQANGKYILVMDADGQHEEEKIPEIWKQLEKGNWDLVVGSRKLENSDYGEMPFHRKCLSIIAEKIGKVILNIPIKDPLSGFFGIQRKILSENLESLNPKGFKILLEIITRIPNLRILEIPYQFRKRTLGKTKLNSFVALDYFLSLLEIRYKIRFSPYFVKYSIVGSMGILVNLGIQFLGDLFLPEEKLLYPENLFLKPSLSVVMGFEISLFHNFLWNHFWTFSDRKERFLTALGKFHLVSLFSFLIQVSAWFYFYNLTLNYSVFPEYGTNLSNLMGILLAFISNYFLNKNLTWKSEN